MTTSSTNKVLLLLVTVVLLVALYPTAFDMRATIYDYTKWGADSLGVLFGFVALILGVGLLPISGGKMKQGLLWFSIGMLIMGAAFFFGPIINHYKIFNADLVEGYHGIGMLGGMIGYLLANYYFLTIVEPQSSARKYFGYYVAAFVIAVLLFYPTMMVHRSLGNTIKYWTELGSFGISAVMVVMTAHAYRRIGGGYKKAMTLLLVSTVVMAICYPFGPVGQPNPFWTGAQGGTLHHGIMALSILLFLFTAFYLKRLEIYSSSTPRAV